MNGIGTYPENSWQSSKPATGSEPAITKTEPAPVFALAVLGSDGLPASRWLKKLQYDLKPSYPPHHPSYPREYVNALDILLVGEAAEWAEENPLVQTKINKADPTLKDVEALKTLLQDRFPQRLTEITTFNIKVELESLKQQSDENLLAYYKRAKSMMERVGARDRAESSTSLTPLETAFLDTVMRSFVKGIHDMDIKKAAARGLTSAIRSFSALYVIVEEARCTKFEVEKLEAAEAKDAELQYYKNLAESRLHPSSQPQAYNPQSNALPSMAPKSNVRPDFSGTSNSIPEGKSQPQQTPYELPPNLPDRTTSLPGNNSWPQPAPYQPFTSYDLTHSNSVSVGWDQQPSLVSELNSMPNSGGETPVEQFNIPQQEKTDRPKRKGQKPVGRKVEATPLAGMIDENSGTFDEPVSVREVLKRNKVDISLIDWMAWSPFAGREQKPLIVPSTSPVQSAPPAQCLPSQTTLPILPPHIQSVPLIESALLIQPLLIESAPLPVQSTTSIVKPALSLPIIGSDLPALPLVEPSLLVAPASVSCAKSVLPDSIGSHPPTLFIIQKASETQALTKQNVYNQDFPWAIAEIFTTNEVTLTLLPIFLDIFMLLARLFVGILHIPRLMGYPAYTLVLSEWAKVRYEEEVKDYR